MNSIRAEKGKNEKHIASNRQVQAIKTTRSISKLLHVNGLDEKK